MKIVNAHHRKEFNCAPVQPSLDTDADHSAPSGHTGALCQNIIPGSCTVTQWWHRSAHVCVCVCQLSGDWLLYLRTDWRWDLEEKLLLLCLLYGSFFTLNAENLFRGHGIPASSCLPELILAALGINKAFSGAKYAAYVLQLSSLYFPADSLLGLVQPLSPAFFS